MDGQNVGDKSRFFETYFRNDKKSASEFWMIAAVRLSSEMRSFFSLHFYSIQKSSGINCHRRQAHSQIPRNEEAPADWRLASWDLPDIATAQLKGWLLTYSQPN